MRYCSASVLSATSVVIHYSRSVLQIVHNFGVIVTNQPGPSTSLSHSTTVCPIVCLHLVSFFLLSPPTSYCIYLEKCCNHAILHIEWARKCFFTAFFVFFVKSHFIYSHSHTNGRKISCGSHPSSIFCTIYFPFHA